MRQRLADFINITFGFRKLFAWIALFIVGIIFRLKGLIDGSQFEDLVKATFLGFVAGNGVEHLVSVAKQYITSNAQSQVVPPPVQADDNLVEPDASSGKEN